MKEYYLGIDIGTYESRGMLIDENMIRLSGVHGIKIVETGLRPGEKLYEEFEENWKHGVKNSTVYASKNVKK